MTVSDNPDFNRLRNIQDNNSSSYLTGELIDFKVNVII